MWLAKHIFVMPTDSWISNLYVWDKMQNKGIRKYISEINRIVPLWLEGLPNPLPETTSLCAS